jgi:hypothetical protein
MQGRIADRMGVVVKIVNDENGKSHDPGSDAPCAWGVESNRMGKGTTSRACHP